MAAATRSLCRTFLQANRQIPLKRKRNQPWRASIQPSQARPFSYSSWRTEEQTPDYTPAGRATAQNSSEDAGASKASEDVLDRIDYATLEVDDLMVPNQPITVQNLTPEARADYEVLPKDQQPKYMALENHYKALLESPDLDNEFHQLARQVAREVDKQESITFPNLPKMRSSELGFWGVDEDDEFGRVEDDDDEFSEDAITSVAHGELELHREMRDYTRIAAWEMPLLTKFAKPFEPPPLTSPLRFRYTTYMGESHPAAKKVVVQFCTRDMPDLTEPQRVKLTKLAGVRYNPDTDVVKMSCEKFEAPAQNKRYLGDLISKLVSEAKDGKDMFEDVPLDLRHHKKRRAPLFPEEWKMTPERVQSLLGQRKQAQLLEASRTPVNGRQVVEEYAKVMPSRMLSH